MKNKMELVKFPLLDSKDLDVLSQALYFLKVSDLRKACYSFSLSESGKKGELIERIIIFVVAGQIKISQVIPSQSLQKNYSHQSLFPNSLMLYGGYKNDSATREFFKELIGPQFHFTAFGVDWLNDRWFKGSPPTYQEFADYWVEEIKRRKKVKVEPKKEWAYISFLQQMNEVMPQASRIQLMQEWKKMQLQKSQIAHSLLKKAIMRLVE